MKKPNPNQLALPLMAAAPTMPTALSRATSTRSRNIEAPAPKPWLCVVLAIDTARRSGWAIYACGELRESGEVDTLAEAVLEQLVRDAQSYAHGAAVPLVLVLEAPFGGNVEVVTALGVARERWLRAWRAGGESPRRVVSVQPSTWRGPVLGRGYVGAARDEVRAAEQRYAATIRRRRVGPDEAAAILIGRWASQAAAVGRCIGRRAVRRSVREWTERRGAPTRS